MRCSPSVGLQIYRNEAHVGIVKADAAATVLESGFPILTQIRQVMGDKPLFLDLKLADIGFRAPD